MSPEYLPLAEKTASYGVSILAVFGASLVSAAGVLKTKTSNSVFALLSFLFFLICVWMLFYMPGKIMASGFVFRLREGVVAAALLSAGFAVFTARAEKRVSGFFLLLPLALCLPDSGFKTFGFLAGIFAAASFETIKKEGAAPFFMLMSALFLSVYFAAPAGQAGKGMLTASVLCGVSAVFAMPLLNRTEGRGAGISAALAETFTFAAVFMIISGGGVNSRAAAAAFGAAVVLNTVRSLTEEDSDRYFDAERRGLIFLALLSAAVCSTAPYAAVCAAAMIITAAASYCISKKGIMSISSLKFSRSAEREGLLIMLAALPLLAAEIYLLIHLSLNIKADPVLKAVTVAALLPYLLAVMNRVFTAAAVMKRTFSGGRMTIRGSAPAVISAAVSAVLLGLLS